MIRAGLLALLGAAVVAVLALAAWAGSGPPPDPVWDRVHVSGVLRVGTDPTYPPFETITGTEYVGYDMDLVRTLATGLGVRVEYVNLPLDSQYDALLQDKVDLLISALPLIWERQKEVRYTQAYYNAGPLLVVRADDAVIQGPNDLAGRRVGVELGSESDLVARRLQRAGIALQLDTGYDDAAAPLTALAAGDVAATISDPLALATYQRAGHTDLRAVGPPLEDQPCVIAVRITARRLAPWLDTQLTALRADGRLAQIMGQP